MKNVIKAKMLLEAAVVIAVALVFVLPGAAVFTNTGNHENQRPILNNNINICETNAVKISDLTNPLAVSAGNIPITPGLAGEDRLPNICMDDLDHVFVSWTHEADVSTSSAGFSYASDPNDPDEWLNNGVLIDIEGFTQLSYVDAARYLHDGLKIFGVFITLDTEDAGGFHIPDVTDWNTWEFYTWTDADESVSEPLYASVSDDSYYHVTSGTYDASGPFNNYIYHEIYLTYDIPACPINMHNDIAGLQGLGYFDAQSVLKTAPAKDIDSLNFPNRLNLIWQYHNESTLKEQIVWKKIDPAVQPDLEYTTWQKYIAEGVNPSIAGSADGKLAIVYKNDTGMILCAHSSNDGDSWEISPIAPGAYPDIYYYDGKLYASYIDAGNLYVVNSTDGGATWEAATKINDQDGTVVAEENAVDMNEGGIVWVDSRNDDKDIYYYQLFIPKPKPKLEASVTTGFALGAKAVVKNTGEAAATNVTWTIVVNGGLFDRELANVPGSIDTLAVGAEEAISTGMFIGLGAIVITVTATCDEGNTATPATADGTQLIIFTIVK